MAAGTVVASPPISECVLASELRLSGVRSDMTHRIGRKSYEPIWTHRRMPKADFLLGVLHRLQGDVGPYFALIHSIQRKTGRQVGFWALARMLFPVVEAVAYVIYRTAGAKNGPAKLLERLGFKYPHVVWQMYRNTLMHHDEMATASCLGRRIAWGLGLGTGHGWGEGLIQVDLRKLYVDLSAFLQREAARSRRRPTSVWVRESFRLPRDRRGPLRREMLRLGSDKALGFVGK